MANAALRNTRVAAGLCPCGLREPRPGLKSCQECSDYSKGVKKRRRKVLAAMGRCTVCGVNIPAPGTATCGTCRESDRAGYALRGEQERARRRTANQARREEAVAQGLCRSCCKRKPRNGRKNCRLCIARQSLRNSLKLIRSMAPRPAPVYQWPEGKPQPADHPWRALDRAHVRKTQWYREHGRKTGVNHGR